MKRDIQNTFFELLRAALWNQEPRLLARHSANEWDEMFSLARQQAVVGLFYGGVSKLHDEWQPPLAFQMKLAAEAARVEEMNKTVDDVQNELMSVFAQEGIKPLVVKGQTLGHYYPQPELRVSGDIDLYFPCDEEDARARHLIETLGLSTRMESDGSWSFYFNEVEVEVHPRVFDLMPKSKERAIIEECGGLVTDEQGMLHLPSCCERLMLNLHILKHCCGTGIRLKQLCDMAVVSVCSKGQNDKGIMTSLYRKTLVLRWSRLLDETLAQYFYLENGHDTQKRCRRWRTASLMKLVMNDGKRRSDWGMRAERVRDADKKKNTVTNFVIHLPFSLFWAPYHVVLYIFILIKGNI